MTRSELEAESKALSSPSLALAFGGYGETQILGLKMSIPLSSIISWRFGTFASQRARLLQANSINPVYGIGWTSDLKFGFPIFLKGLLRPYLISELNGIQEFSPDGTACAWSGRFGVEFMLTQHFNSFLELGAGTSVWRHGDARPLSGVAVLVGSAFSW
jgi:hypothetical protein